VREKDLTWKRTVPSQSLEEGENWPVKVKWKRDGRPKSRRQNVYVGYRRVM